MFSHDGRNSKQSKGDEDMAITIDKNKLSQSQSFIKLRRKMQNQMKKENVKYEDILRLTKESEYDK